MVKDGWYCCPTCGKRIQKLESSSVIYGTPLRCRVCKVDWYPTIFQGAELGDDEPFPMRSEETSGAMRPPGRQSCASPGTWGSSSIP